MIVCDYMNIWRKIKLNYLADKWISTLNTEQETDTKNAKYADIIGWQFILFCFSI